MSMKRRRSQLSLRQAIRGFLATHRSGSAVELSAAFISDETAFVRKWLTGKITKLIEREIGPTRALKSEPYQMFLCGFEGLAVRVPLKTGVKALGTATISELRESLHVMVAAARKKAEANPKTVALANLIEEMNPIARKNRNLTVERYCEIKAAQLQKIMR